MSAPQCRSQSGSTGRRPAGSQRSSSQRTTPSSPRPACGSGEHLLVHGAAGGVGTAAVQLGRVAGARVTATVRREELRPGVEQLGARAIAPEGFEEEGPFDVVLELVGASNLAANLSALTIGGPDRGDRRGRHGAEGRDQPAVGDAEARTHPRLHAARPAAGGEGDRHAASGAGGAAAFRGRQAHRAGGRDLPARTRSRTPTRGSKPGASSARSCSWPSADVCPIGICPMR